MQRVPLNLTRLEAHRDLRFDKVYAGGAQVYGHQVDLQKMYGWGDNAFQNIREGPETVIRQPKRVKACDTVSMMALSGQSSFKVVGDRLYS